ncbi:MAG: NAD(P)/FAD-dependent oxidoreductase, partial [Nanoarchaeota archaeon]
GSEFGGQYNESGEVLNYPGIVKTTGIEFSSIMREQMKFNGVKVKAETAAKIEIIDDHYKVFTEKGAYETQAILIATGARPRKLDIKGEDRFFNKGLTYCAICDGPLFAGRDVAVVGSGSSALEAVGFLKDIANKIYLVIRGDHMKGHEYLQEQAKNHPKVEIIYNAPTTEVLGEAMVTGLKYRQDNYEKTLDVQGIFAQVGRMPNTEFLEGVVERDDYGYVKVDKAMHTNKEGIFAVGDCADVTEHQYAISAGQGCTALIEASRYIMAKKHKKV